MKIADANDQVDRTRWQHPDLIRHEETNISRLDLSSHLVEMRKRPILKDFSIWQGLREIDLRNVKCRRYVDYPIFDARMEGCEEMREPAVTGPNFQNASIRRERRQRLG